MPNIFDDIKQKVKIEDVASYLGYKVNPKAGTRGLYLEMVMPDGKGGKTDTIVINRKGSKRWETYFHRDGKGGSVIDFVRENLRSLGVSAGGDEWKSIFDAFRKFTNLPEDAYTKDLSLLEWQKNKTPPAFDSSRYESVPVTEDMDAAKLIFGQRALTEDTIRTFAPWIELIRNKTSSFQHPSLGFPYREPGSDKIVGYEVRGYGTFKGMATGTNATTAAWIVDKTPTGNPRDVRNVFFAESAYDIMALYQYNRLMMHPENSVFISTGGQMSQQQVSRTMKYYSNARAIDCFDNDIYGRLYGIRMAAIVSGVHLEVVKTDEGARFSADGKQFFLPTDKVTLLEFAKQVPLSLRCGMKKAPEGYKDWNDVVMHRQMGDMLTPSKYDRDEKLRLKRMSGIKH